MALTLMCLWGVGLLAIAALARSTRAGYRPVSTTFWSFILCWLVLAPTVQLPVGQAAWDDWQTVRDYALTLRAALLILAFALTAFIGEELASRHTHRHHPIRADRHPFASPLIIAALALALPFAGAISILAQGGVANLFQDRSTRAEAIGASETINSGASQGMAVLLPGVIGLVLFHLSLSLVRSQSSQCLKRLGTLTLAEALLAEIMFNNPLSSSRFISAMAFGSMVVAVLQPRGRLSGRVAVPLTLAVILVAYPLSSQSSDGGVASAFVGGDFDGFLLMLQTVKYVDAFGIGHGIHYLSALLFFVPRSIWDGKALPSTFEVSEYAGYWFANLSEPLPGELYLDFGIGGIIAGGLLMGWVIGWLDTGWLHGRTGIATMLAPIFGLAMLGIVRGPLGSLAPSYLPVFILILVSRAGTVALERLRP